ncbi:MAG: endonuclease domain-containing protein [Patescibacteria group bacterium]
MTDIFNKKEFAFRRKKLRQESPRAERLLWHYLKGKQVHGQKFRRQAGINRYVVDFYCPQINLAIEVDGGSHTATKYDEEKDKLRQNKIEQLNIRFLRFNNEDVYLRMNEVMDIIYNEVHVILTSPQPPPS